MVYGRPTLTSDIPVAVSHRTPSTETDAPGERCPSRHDVYDWQCEAEAGHKGPHYYDPDGHGSETWTDAPGEGRCPECGSYLECTHPLCSVKVPQNHPNSGKGSGEGPSTCPECGGELDLGSIAHLVCCDCDWTSLDDDDDEGSGEGEEGGSERDKSLLRRGIERGIFEYVPHVDPYDDEKWLVDLLEKTAFDALRSRPEPTVEGTALTRLHRQLGLLLMDEDLTDEKLRGASEGLLPKLYDAISRRFRERPGGERKRCYIEDVDLEHWEDERGQMVWREDDDVWAKMLPCTLIIHQTTEEEGEDG